MAVYFHGNFGLNRPRMAQLLNDGLENPAWDNAQLAAPQGYGAPFAQRYRSWLHKTGLIEQGSPIRLTPMGAIVHNKDAALESDVTSWFMHWELVTDPHRAEVWHYFHTEFRNGHPSFTREELTMALMETLSEHSVKHFGPGSKLTPVITRKVIECYTATEALGELGLVVAAGDRYEFRSPRKRGPWSTPARLAASYR